MSYNQQYLQLRILQFYDHCIHSHQEEHHNTNRKIYGEGYYGLETSWFYEKFQENYDKEIPGVKFSYLTHGDGDFPDTIIKHKEKCPFADIVSKCGMTTERWYNDNHAHYEGRYKTLEELFISFEYKKGEYDLVDFSDISVPKCKYYVRCGETGEIVYSTDSKEKAEEFMRNYFFLETNE